MAGGCPVSRIDELAATIALMRIGGRPWSHYADLIESVGSAVAVLEGNYEPDEPEALTLFSDPDECPDLDAIAVEIESWRSEGIDLVSVLDDGYPANLRTIYNRPPLLFVRGELIEADDYSIAVVGTRTPTDEGLATATEVATGLASAGLTVVSGLAQGIDTAAHTATLAGGGRTIAVIGTGLRRAYPAENTALQQTLAAEAAVVSQFWPDTPPTKKTFPMRNVVMSGIALATVVIEASDTSGARMQARFALDHGRPVFLMSGLLKYQWAREYADRPGTFVVESPDEILHRVDRLTSLDSLTPA
jgi:DNA processing protein